MLAQADHAAVEIGVTAPEIFSSLTLTEGVTVWDILLAVGCFIAGTIVGGVVVGLSLQRHMQWSQPVWPTIIASYDVHLLRLLRSGNTSSLCSALERHLDRSLVGLVEVVQTTQGAEQDEHVRKALTRICDYRDQHPSPGPVPVLSASQLNVDRALEIARSVARTSTA